MTSPTTPTTPTTTTPTTPTTPIDEFRALHASGCFVMPNPWDVGSAVVLHQAGFRALATTSAGFGFTRGLPDRVWAVPVDAMLAHLAEIVAATPLPVNADFQAGYAHDHDQLAANIVACVQTGVAGLSIEDATGDPSAPLYPRDEAIERVRVARAAIDGTGRRVLLTARCEAYLTRDPDPARTAIDRLAAFAEAGADCVFAPAVRDPQTIAAIVKAVAPVPVNVIVTSPGPGMSVPELAALGVRRISVGSALARVAWGAFLRSLRSIAETGTFTSFADAAAFSDLDAAFKDRALRS